MGKSLLVGLILLSFLTADLEVGHYLGGARLYREDNIKYDGTNYALTITGKPYNRLQFGLKYTYTQIFSPKYYYFNNQGFMLTSKLLISPYTKKSPYLGYSVGWLNSVLNAERINYNCRGSFTEETALGYNFNKSPDSRFFIEARRAVIYLNQDDHERLEMRSLVFGIAHIFFDHVKVKQKTMDKEEGLRTKKEYLSIKLQENEMQIERRTVLIQKYNERIFNDPDNQALKEERDFLVKEREELQGKSKAMRELLAL